MEGEWLFEKEGEETTNEVIEVTSQKSVHALAEVAIAPFQCVSFLRLFFLVSQKHNVINQIQI